MAAIKLLISGFENTGKSTMASKINNAMVVNFDRKEYGFPVPHMNITEYSGIEALIDTINLKLGAYQEKFGKLPETLVLDTVTQFYSTMQRYNGDTYKGFDEHKANNKDTLNLNAYIEDVLIANGVNVVIVAHTMYDADTARHIIPATGQFGKAGSWISVVNDAVFIEKKSGKYLIHQKSMKFPCRTTLTELEDSVDSTNYDINDHIAKLTASKLEAEEFVL
jgi:hypothetical protein